MLSFKGQFTAAAATVAVLACVSPLAAQAPPSDGYRNARRLGGTTSFYRPPVTTPARLRRMVAAKGIEADIRKVLADAGLSDTADAVLSTLKSTAPTVTGASCNEATPADGQIVECDFPVGGTLDWMAYRPNIRKRDRTPVLLNKLRWAGARTRPQPFKAYLFRVTTDDKIYTFVVPKPCGNLSLASAQDVPKEPVNIAVQRDCNPETGLLRVTVRATGRDLARVKRIAVTVNGKRVGELTGPSWTLTTDVPGEYMFAATDMRDRSFPVARDRHTVDKCEAAPKPVVVAKPICVLRLSSIPVKGGHEITIDASGSTSGMTEPPATVTVEVRDDAGVMVGQKLTLDSSRIAKITVPNRAATYRATATVTSPGGSTVCEESITIVRPPSSAHMFMDALIGKERRIRPIEGTNREYGQCSPLLGLKFGAAKRFANDWEVAGALGAAISLVTQDDKVNESALFADLEFNKYLNNGSFVGTGISAWDITRSDTFTPAWILHFGVPVTQSKRVFFIGESRLFLDGIDEVDSNYLFWGGIRVHFRRN